MIKYYNFVMLHIYIHICVCIYVCTCTCIHCMYINLRLDMDTYMYMCNFANSGTSKKNFKKLKKVPSRASCFCNFCKPLPHLSCFILHVWNT